MKGIVDLEQLLANLAPKRLGGEWVFCSLSASQLDAFPDLLDTAIASFREDEGLSLLLPLERAESANLRYDGVFVGITLSVHSSLQAVGLTAEVAERLAAAGISANVIAAAFHDHVFVALDKADLALQLLRNI